MRNDVPIVLISETADEPLRQAALDAGVVEFLIRPVRPRELAARCKNLLRLRANGESEKLRARSLDLELSDTLRRLDDRERETLLRLSAATESRDHGSSLHSMRVARIAGLIARALGMTIEQSRMVELAAPLHDVGKIGVPDSILQKTTPLSEQEWTLMRRHAVIGYEILRNSQNPLVQLGSTMALCHHERWGGGGYPHGLVGADIPQAARIVAVADVFDALLSDRPYKRVWACDRAVEYVLHHRGTRFDPACVDALFCDMRLVREITS
jgi:two-component system, response regulator RpfG